MANKSDYMTSSAYQAALSREAAAAEVSTEPVSKKLLGECLSRRYRELGLTSSTVGDCALCDVVCVDKTEGLQNAELCQVNLGGVVDTSNDDIAREMEELRVNRDNSLVVKK